MQMTPLTMAVLRGDLGLVRSLVRRGADVNAPCGRTFRQATALHMACYRGNVDVVRCLLELGADLHRPECDGLDAMKMAAVRGEATTLEFLIQV